MAGGTNTNTNQQRGGNHQHSNGRHSSGRRGATTSSRSDTTNNHPLYQAWSRNLDSVMKLAESELDSLGMSYMLLFFTFFNQY